jgi:hypothetical protein
MPPKQAIFEEESTMATTVTPQRGLTFDDVWAALMETRERQEATARQSEKDTQELREALEKSRKEAERQRDDFNKRFGDFTRRFGEVVEYMIAPNLLVKFREYGLKFHESMTDRVFSDDDNKPLFEVDVFLQNSDKAMLVEIKTKLTAEDVREHVERLEKMRAYADLRGNKHAFLGAVAGVVVTASVKEYALGQGLYVIEPSGETFTIIPPNGQPKEW